MEIDAARVVVIGGGITGCSVAYHLALAGWTDVLVPVRQPGRDRLRRDRATRPRGDGGDDLLDRWRDRHRAIIADRSLPGHVPRNTGTTLRPAR